MQVYLFIILLAGLTGEDRARFLRDMGEGTKLNIQNFSLPDCKIVWFAHQRLDLVYFMKYQTIITQVTKVFYVFLYCFPASNMVFTWEIRMAPEEQGPPEYAQKVQNYSSFFIPKIFYYKTTTTTTKLL